jgi:hypothetical protein
LTSKLDEGLLELWNGFRDTHVRERVIACASALADNGFTAVPVPTASEANRVIVSQVPAYRTVLYWDDSTLEELGIISTLQARGNSTKSAMQLASGRGLRKPRIPHRSIYLSTVSAVTMDGMLVKVTPELVPIWGPGRAPESLILVVGFNHIVEGLDEGFRLAKDECVPQCARRLGLPLKCATTERCVECDSPIAICAVNTIVTRQPDTPQITMVLIGERL